MHPSAGPDRGAFCGEKNWSLLLYDASQVLDDHSTAIECGGEDHLLLDHNVVENGSDIAPHDLCSKGCFWRKFCLLSKLQVT